LHPSDGSAGAYSRRVVTANGAVQGPPLPGEVRWANRERLSLALLAVVFAVHFLDRQLLAILIPPIKAELGLSDTALGFISGLAFTLFFSTVGLVIARIADRVDRARIVTWSLVAFSVMTALCGLAMNFWQLALARIGVGAGEGGTNPASHSLIADMFAPASRATAMAVYSIGPNLGMLLAFGIGGWLAQEMGWRAAFFAAGLLGLIVALATRFYLVDPHARDRAQAPVADLDARAVARTMLASPTLRHLAAAATLAMAVATGVITWLPALLVRAHGFSLSQIGVFLAVVLGVAGAVGTYAVGRIADRTSDAPRKLVVLVTLQCVIAASLPLGVLADSGIGAVLLLSLPCVLLVGYVGPTLALIQGIVDPRARAFSAAIMLLCANLLASGLGPFAVGLLSDALAPTVGDQSLRYALLLMSLLCLWSAWHYWRAMPTLVAELRA